MAVITFKMAAMNILSNSASAGTNTTKTSVGALPAHSDNSWLFMKTVGGGLSLFPAMLITLFCYVSIGITFRFVNVLTRRRRYVPSIAWSGAMIAASCSCLLLSLLLPHC